MLQQLISRPEMSSFQLHANTAYSLKH